MLQRQFSVGTHSMSLRCPEAPSRYLPRVPVGARVGHLCKKIFKIYQIQYLPLKFWKSPKNKKVSSLQVPTRQLPGVPVSAQAYPVWVSQVTKIFFFKVGNRPQEAMLRKILEFSPLISDICLYHHFCQQLNLPFSELNITPSVRPNLGIFKNF